jgi:hypothetical protein
MTKRTVDQDGNIYEIQNETSGGMDLVYVGRVDQTICDPDTCLGPAPDFEYICDHAWSAPMKKFNEKLFAFLSAEESK